MTTPRIINITIWTVIFIVLASCVTYQWHYMNNCSVWSLVAAYAFYGACIFALAISIDASIQGK